MPREVHETYAVDPDDPENREKDHLVSYVVVTRESAWDDKSRARALALTEYEETICTCGCGLPREIAHKKQGFMVHRVTCYAGQAVTRERRKDEEKHKDDPTWGDGLRYFAVPATDADIEAARTNARRDDE